MPQSFCNKKAAMIKLNAETRPILYSFRRCPYAMRARMAITKSGITCELREIVLRNKPEHMLTISPKATIPVIQLVDGTVMDESFDIMLWALSQNDPDGWLKPLSGNVDDALLLIKQLDGPFKHHLDLYKYSSRFETEDPALNRQKALENLQPLIDRLSHNTFLFGNKPCIADIASFPFVRQFANTDVTWFENSTPLILQNWLNSFIQSSLFKSIFAKYTPWTPGDPETLFPDPV